MGSRPVLDDEFLRAAVDRHEYIETTRVRQASYYVDTLSARPQALEWTCAIKVKELGLAAFRHGKCSDCSTLLVMPSAGGIDVQGCLVCTVEGGDATDRGLVTIFEDVASDIGICLVGLFQRLSPLVGKCGMTLCTSPSGCSQCRLKEKRSQNLGHLHFARSSSAGLVGNPLISQQSSTRPG